MILNLEYLFDMDLNYYESYVVLPIDEWGPEPKYVLRIINLLIEEEFADPDRIYLTGVSMGGFAVSDFIFEYPEIPACAVMVCGCSYNSDKAPYILDIPIKLYHSDDDNIVSVDTSRNFYDGLIQSGGKKAEYFETTGYRHSCWNYAYGDDLLEWIFIQSKNEKSKIVI
jgi:predicted peptidase